MKLPLAFFLIAFTLQAQFKGFQYRLLQMASISNDEENYRDIVRQHNIAKIEDHNSKT
jgi:hypothetical protein